MAEFYSETHCGGLIEGSKSGKGGVQRAGGKSGMRHQLVWAWPAWCKEGVDTYWSSRWDGSFQIFDVIWSPDGDHGHVVGH